MSSNEGRQSADGHSERPRPQYGEYAPPGWSWQPPDRPESPAAPGERKTTNSYGEQSGSPLAGTSIDVPTQRDRVAPAWNRPVTVVLLILGILGTMFTIAMQLQLPVAMELLHAQEGLPAYVEAGSVATTITVGSVAQGLIWIVTAGVSVLLLTRRTTAFWVPLVGAAASLVTFFVVISLVIATDAMLVEQLGTGSL